MAEPISFDVKKICESDKPGWWWYAIIERFKDEPPRGHIAAVNLKKPHVLARKLSSTFRVLVSLRVVRNPKRSKVPSKEYIKWWKYAMEEDDSRDDYPASVEFIKGGLDFVELGGPAEQKPTGEQELLKSQPTENK